MFYLLIITFMNREKTKDNFTMQLA